MAGPIRRSFVRRIPTKARKEPLRKKFFSRAFGVLANLGHLVAPSFINLAFIDQGSATTKTFSLTINAGDTVLVCVGLGSTTGIHVTSVIDSGGSTYTQLSSQILTSDNRFATEIWGTLAATASTTLTVNYSVSGSVVIGAARYTGVSGFGNVGNGTSTGSTAISTTSTMQNTNNVSVMSVIQRTSQVGTAVEGNIRLNNFASAQAATRLTVEDNTSVNTGPLNVSYSTAGSVQWAACSIELKSLL